MLTDQLIRLNGRSRAAVAGALILILLYAVYRWSLAPHVDYAQALHQYGPVTEALQRETRSIAGGLAEEQQYLEDLQLRFSELRAMLFGYEEAQDFFSELAQLAQACRCSLVSLHIEPLQELAQAEQENVIIKTVESNLTLEGPLPAVRSFIQALQDQPRGVYLQTLQISSAEPPDGASKCYLELTMYCLNE